jgi:hypothetical protein
MNRLSISFTNSQIKALKDSAREDGCYPPDIIRRLVDLWMREEREKKP